MWSAEPDFREGIHLGDVSFSNDAKAGYLDMDSGAAGFALIGAGLESYEILFHYPLVSEKASPLGLYRLYPLDMWNYFADSGEVPAAYLAHEEPLRARLGAAGMILVTEASPDRVEGLIFGLILQNAAGVDIDSFPLGTFSIR